MYQGWGQNNNGQVVEWAEVNQPSGQDTREGGGNRLQYRWSNDDGSTTQEDTDDEEDAEDNNNVDNDNVDAVNPYSDNADNNNN